MNVKNMLAAALLVAVTLITADSFGWTFNPLTMLVPNASAREVVKMSPRIREYESAIVGTSLSIRELRALIPKVTIFDDDLKDSGELVDFFDSVMGSPGARIEASGLTDYRNLSRFDIYRPCTFIENPNGIRNLGCLSLLTAQATRVSSTRRTDILRLDAVYNGVFRGQRIVPRATTNASSISTLYRPKQPISGKIVDILEGLSAGAQYRVVVVNLGQEDKVEDGVVLTIYRNNEEADPFLPDLRPAWRQVVSNESRPIGQIVIFDVFEQASLALVLRSEKEISLNDFVRN